VCVEIENEIQFVSSPRLISSSFASLLLKNGLTPLAPLN